MNPDIAHLVCMYERMADIHGDVRSADHMVKFKEIISNLHNVIHKPLSPSEVALRYGILESTLQNWRENKTGGPAYIKAGRSAVYRMSDLIAWEDANRKESN